MERAKRDRRNTLEASLPAAPKPITPVAIKSKIESEPLLGLGTIDRLVLWTIICAELVDGFARERQLLAYGDLGTPSRCRLERALAT